MYFFEIILKIIVKKSQKICISFNPCATFAMSKTIVYELNITKSNLI